MLTFRLFCKKPVTVETVKVKYEGIRLTAEMFEDGSFKDLGVQGIDYNPTTQVLRVNGSTEWQKDQPYRIGDYLIKEKGQTVVIPAARFQDQWKLAPGQ
jgi:hypothetical protein